VWIIQVSIGENGSPKVRFEGNTQPSSWFEHRAKSNRYIGIPNNYVGLQLSSHEQLYETGRRAHAAGWQLATHANGDLAIDRILGVYEQIQKELPKKDPRFRIEHCTLLTDTLIQRMANCQRSSIHLFRASAVQLHGVPPERSASMSKAD
jgi:hypothetical protein